MENVVLIVHLILALCLIGVVLLQRSEGGGLGMGGGGGGVSSRAPVTALGKLTWVFGVAFTVTSITLTIIAAQNSADTSVIDRLGIEVPSGGADPVLPPAGDLLPPPADGGLTAPPPVE